MSLKIVKDEIESNWNAAASIWDVRALANLYTPDALFFGLLPEPYVGRAEVERYFNAYKDVLAGVSLNLVEQEIRALSPTAFLAQGFGNIRNYRKSGETVPNRVRTSLGIVKTDGEWKIMLHHFSQVPPAAP